MQDHVLFIVLITCKVIRMNEIRVHNMPDKFFWRRRYLHHWPILDWGDVLQNEFWRGTLCFLGPVDILDGNNQRYHHRSYRRWRENRQHHGYHSDPGVDYHHRVHHHRQVHDVFRGHSQCCVVRGVYGHHHGTGGAYLYLHCALRRLLLD